MSYLLQYARRRTSVVPRRPVARVDSYARLNRPGLYGNGLTQEAEIAERLEQRRT